MDFWTFGESSKIVIQGANWQVKLQPQCYWIIDHIAYCCLHFYGSYVLLSKTTGYIIKEKIWKNSYQIGNIKVRALRTTWHMISLSFNIPGDGLVHASPHPAIKIQIRNKINLQVYVDWSCSLIHCSHVYDRYCIF